jgi:hypothetical protein|eukprot:SAG25_NODE_1400_length_3115_cov_2.560676_3_plen_55_part_00
MVAHELCHFLVVPRHWCCATVWRQALLHVLTVPSVGLTTYEYYAYLHLGHHAIL